MNTLKALPKSTLASLSLLIAVTLFSFFSLVRGYTEPNTLPPGGNVTAPLNMGGTEQVKPGNLGSSTGIIVRPAPKALPPQDPDYKILNVGGTLHFKCTNPSPLFPCVPDVSDSASRMVIGQDGNVGIGTTSPDGKLDVMQTISGLTTGLRFSSWHFPGITAGGIIDSYDDNGTVRSLVLQNNGGNVGIGTTAPIGKLDVRDWSGRQVLLADSTNGSYSFLNASQNVNLGGNAYWDGTNWNRFDTARGAVVINSSGNIGAADFLTAPSGPNPITNFSSKMIIRNDGNVGIGTTSPDGTLDVMKTISGLTTGLRFSSWHFPGITAGGIIDSYDDNGTVRSLVLQNNGGNVGIGTTSPGAKLDVQGRIVTQGDAIEIGGSKLSGDQYAYLDLRGDDGYQDYGLRLLRGNGGPNTWSEITHRGTGDFVISAVEGANLKFRTQNTDRMIIDSFGRVGIGTTNLESSPQAGLKVITDSGGAAIYGDNQVFGIYGLGVSGGVFGSPRSGSTTGVGGYFRANDFSTSYNLRLSARNNSARGLYLYTTTVQCADGEASVFMDIGGQRSISGVYLCVRGY